jgi:glycosyltransferase involved in cell wall biosynthesis
MLAEKFAALGHRVVVVTTTAATGDTGFAFDVLRSPGSIKHLFAVRSADVVLHMNLSLRGLWPLAIVRRPLVVAHHGRYRRADGSAGPRDRLKYCTARFTTNIAVSDAVKNDLPPSTVVIGSAYDDSLFVPLPRERGKDLVFVGRLVSEKGVDLLLRALAELSACGVRPTLTVVGDGPEEDRLRRTCDENGLSDRVVFAGRRTGIALVELINQHAVMVVPSRNEGFGISALEGIACGCVVVASDAGGLPEAVGKCGITFGNGNVFDLRRALNQALSDSTLRARLAAEREAHLARFTRDAVARLYLEVIEGAVMRARAN